MWATPFPCSVRCGRSATCRKRPGQEGVADLAGALFSYGTKSLDRLAYQKALDDIAAQASAGTSFSLKVLTPQFQAGMKLLADNELHPAFPADAFGIVRQQTAQGLAGLLHSPDYLVGRALRSALAPAGDPTRREATPGTVMALTPPDLDAFYRAAYRPDLTTIVVAGDVTPKLARQVVDETFGSWQADGKTPAIDLPPVGPSARSAARIADPTSVQDSATLAETIPLAVTDPRRFTLMLGNTILGGGFFSRLYSDLRIRTGYVYSVESALSWASDAQRLHGFVRVRSAECGSGAGADRARYRGDADRTGERSGTDPRQGADAAAYSDAACQYRQHCGDVCAAGGSGLAAGYAGCGGQAGVCGDACGYSGGVPCEFAAG